MKRQVFLRLDADILACFKQRHPKYQSAINSVLQYSRAAITRLSNRLPILMRSLIRKQNAER
ncbi:MAG: BrnA antitoxin family protein [Desulfovibrio sp.]|nr:BrnA antitoxin family protein [Desulfovibrio sp.]